MITRKWVFDPAHTEIQFKVRHLMISTVTGQFETFQIFAETVGEDFMKANVSFVADVSSVTTNNPERDAHLKSIDFFDAANHPKIIFMGTKYENVDNDGSYELYGDLTIRGITKNIKLDVEFGGVVKDPWGNTKAGFTINGKINRKEWGLIWNNITEAGSVLVGEEIRITCEVQLIEKNIKPVLAV